LSAIKGSAVKDSRETLLRTEVPFLDTLLVASLLFNPNPEEGKS
jgi:hypothetical protein